MFNKIKKLLLAKEATEISNKSLNDEEKLIAAIERNYYDDINYINDKIQKEAAMGGKSIMIDLPSIAKPNSQELKYLQIYFDKKGYTIYDAGYHTEWDVIIYAYIKLSWK